MKRAIELSLKSAQEDEHKRNSVADSDDDEELKKALAISLKQITGNENSGSNDPSGESVTISSECKYYVVAKLFFNSPIHFSRQLGHFVFLIPTTF